MSLPILCFLLERRPFAISTILISLVSLKRCSYSTQDLVCVGTVWVTIALRIDKLPEVFSSLCRRRQTHPFLPPFLLTAFHLSFATFLSRQRNRIEGWNHCCCCCCCCCCRWSFNCCLLSLTEKPVLSFSLFSSLQSLCLSHNHMPPQFRFVWIEELPKRPSLTLSSSFPVCVYGDSFQNQLSIPDQPTPLCKVILVLEIKTNNRFLFLKC